MVDLLLFAGRGGRSARYEPNVRTLRHRRAAPALLAHGKPDRRDPGHGVGSVALAQRTRIGPSRPANLQQHQLRSCLMISVIVTPSFSSTSTTSPRATSRLLT